MKNTYFQNMDFPASRWHSRGQRLDPAYLHQTHYERLDFFGDQAFLFPKMNIGMMLVASTAIQAPSLLLKKAVSTFNKS